MNDHMIKSTADSFGSLYLLDVDLEDVDILNFLEQMYLGAYAFYLLSMCCAVTCRICNGTLRESHCPPMIP